LRRRSNTAPRIKYDPARCYYQRMPHATMFSFCHRLGALRCGLAFATLLVICAAPFADGSVHMHDWRLFPSVIAPTMMMMLVFTLPLDMTMARIFMADAQAQERERFRSIIRFEALMLILMLLAWVPFMFRVLDFSPFS
jgi:hypothetical protein